MKLFKIFLMAFLLLVTWAVDVLHLGVFVPPKVAARDHPPGVWIDKSRFGMHQLILQGAPYDRGLEAGRLTQGLLYREEKELIHKLQELVPSNFLLSALELVAMRWFWGIDAYFESWMTQEMYGVSKSASHDFDHVADPFTRQIGYHGVHEVGQLAVDRGAADKGCTVVALPYRDGFVVGRNFDFEATRTLDTEKILKWVFPDKGYAFVSVIWGGMVGAVTGVNEHGVYISMNAAGTMDFRRFGTPSSLVLLKALQNSKTADEALHILRDETMFITDIFVVADKNRAYRVEKTPHHFEAFALTSASIVTNHLIGAAWKDDGFNRYRRDELTSSIREKRGEELIKSFPDTSVLEADKVDALALSVLRDKGGLPLGSRQAIDALIATHSVIYNAPEGVLYVSAGPAVSGPFTGFDLRASFASRTPIATRSLPRDPLVSDAIFDQVRAARGDH
jgi:predicted choloylglycine hydrolase